MHRQHLPTTIIVASLFASASYAECASFEPEASVNPFEYEGIVGEITLTKLNVFDLSKSDEDKWLYRLANRLHIVTKNHVIRGQLLFTPGDQLDARLAEESERILRQNPYFYDASIKTTPGDDGSVDVEVITRDVWTLGPDLSLSRKGGENQSRFGIEEQNLLGLGQSVRFNHEENVDRRSDSFEFNDRHVAGSWLSAFLHLADNSDGESQQVALTRPFYALDTRWSAGVRLLNDNRRNTLYTLGTEAAEYQSKQRYADVFAGWSKGLQKGWVRRWTAGVVFDERQYSEVQMPTLPSAIPADRKLIYPFLGFEVLQDEFETARNRDQIGRTEDVLLGARFSGSIGWADESFGADRDALLYSASASRGLKWSGNRTLILSANASGRLESGHTANAILALAAHYYLRRSEKHLFFATLQGSAGLNLDLDNPVQLGGDSGLRGYPLRYQSGDSHILITVEQRYFTDWYPFRLARIGGAIFADAGRVWGPNPLGAEPRGWLTDVGIGLRIAPTRGSSRKMVHLDLAFPLNGDDSIDNVQILLEAKRSF